MLVCLDQSLTCPVFFSLSSTPLPFSVSLSLSLFLSLSLSLSLSPSLSLSLPLSLSLSFPSSFQPLDSSRLVKSVQVHVDIRPQENIVQDHHQVFLILINRSPSKYKISWKVWTSGLGPNTNISVAVSALYRDTMRGLPLNNLSTVLNLAPSSFFTAGRQSMWLSISASFSVASERLLFFFFFLRGGSFSLSGIFSRLYWAVPGRFLQSPVRDLPFKIEAPSSF